MAPAWRFFPAFADFPAQGGAAEEDTINRSPSAMLIYVPRDEYGTLLLPHAALALEYIPAPCDVDCPSMHLIRPDTFPFSLIQRMFLAAATPPFSPRR